MELYLSQHFKLSQFTYSTAAVRHGIDNTPQPEALVALTCLVVIVLQPLKCVLNRRIFIKSGYRSEKLNMILEGRKKSLYTNGEAALIKVDGGVMDIHPALIDHQIPFYKCIIHRNQQFAELSYKRNGPNLYQIIYI